ncbi:sulfurtransferase [Rhodobacter veldkampii DSM 11550]|uniref:Sulfurtransferase n=1 Tax=Phaeovulum veldkampii DSM 11550 TaxID=1185920 RepID=A0A2T4JLF5_9RHOB|nr:rhodanese-like domain-containing protein [Phaeovulum veldkampii]MBK5947028.1 sulfurtransferase [Phaeovulum veldkampii DSM 11550]PTE18718.1 sulfurtransferase [Phaeovulum veldkampii DSM 11550]TDQ57275.1 thiosulfate/3-mercaptopyruvate sulfurtransferase [Phaeovulum veldkampii DSM 11550]
MNKILALAAAIALVQAPAFAQGAFGPLIAPADLAAQADALLILDIRPASTEDGKKPYAEGHIPGAVAAPYGLFRGPAENPGAVPAIDKLTEVLRSLGVTPGRPTVIVHQGSDETDFGAAARVYWTLKSSGVSQLAILNGGFDAWTGAGLPVSTEAVAPVVSDITVTFADTWLATTDDVLAVVEGKAVGDLIDARPESFWAGEQAHASAARPGTLPQSKYFTHSRWFTSGPSLIDGAAVQSLAAANGFQQGDQLVSFCNTGHWAATNWFALSELAGIEGVRLYPESMVGWSQAGLPMDNTPGPIRNLWNQIKSVF